MHWILWYNTSQKVYNASWSSSACLPMPEACICWKSAMHRGAWWQGIVPLPETIRKEKQLSTASQRLKPTFETSKHRRKLPDNVIFTNVLRKMCDVIRQLTLRNGRHANDNTYCPQYCASAEILPELPFCLHLSQDIPLEEENISAFSGYGSVQVQELQQGNQDHAMAARRCDQSSERLHLTIMSLTFRHDISSSFNKPPWRPAWT